MNASMYLKHDFNVKKIKLCQRNKWEVLIIFSRLFSAFTLSNQRNKYKHQHSCEVNKTAPGVVGGGRSLVIYGNDLIPYSHIGIPEKNVKYKFDDYILLNDAQSYVTVNNSLICCSLPLNLLSSCLTIKQIQNVAASHKLHIPARTSVVNARELIEHHICTGCHKFVSVFQEYTIASVAERKQIQRQRLNMDQKRNILSKMAEYHLTSRYHKTHKIAKRKHYQKSKEIVFPPLPPSPSLIQKIIRYFCADTSPFVFMESGCAVCGKLTQQKKLSNLINVKNINLLCRKDVSRLERFKDSDPISEIDGPILAENCNKICENCLQCLSKGKVPLLALANGVWLGEIPDALRNLTYAEKLLIARVRHNRCIIRVSSGMRKMRANAVSFANPMPKIYNILPPPLKDVDEVLAFIYTGPCKPTRSDFERTPLLVRRHKVAVALEWLKLNHIDYDDLEISQENLNEYPENGPPVVVDYRPSTSNKNPEATSVHDMEDEDGAEDGQCPFVVHGITGEEYSTKSIKAIKAIALEHLTSEGKILGIGHEETPESIYKNPQLFPQMMPWLFPYGLGGIGQTRHRNKLSAIVHKRHLLMYHDKRFQKDPFFPLISFNHEQIKGSTTGGYLLAEKHSFNDISKRLLNVNVEVLSELSKRMTSGERIKPETEEEKNCFQLINDLDHIGNHVDGSITKKKFMRNEIWSLISYKGAPSWFITFAPADNKHPISLYFADTQETFSPALRGYDDRYRLIANNPVAGARFFHYMSEMFIKHVLGVGTNHPGLYGDTSAYYGTVEQQGRLTLHMHMLLWIKGALTPQEIRDRIMDTTSDFQKKMVEYLEGVHMGEFMTGTMEHVKDDVIKNISETKTYKDPTQTLPVPPPKSCEKKNCETCEACKDICNWKEEFEHTVDDLILRSNVHECRTSVDADEKSKKKERRGCLNKRGTCKARFPRQIFDETQVDPKTGALNVKKGEEWINTFTPAVTYLLRCNTDVTSLLSGTAIKAIVAYISDYVTKPSLKTYTIFDAICNVFNRNSEMIGGTLKRKEKARNLLIQIVNSLTAKMEIGAPMASLYLLGNPDHYTNYEFVVFYWRSYVNEVLKSWKTNDNPDKQKVVINKNAEGEYVGYSSVDDYIFRPDIFSDTTLYEWIQIYKKSKRSKAAQKEFLNSLDTEFEEDDIMESEFEETDDEQEPKYYAFQPEHPLYKTHQISINKSIELVPNFVGGSLPRCDHGDREYYCAAMLTLFKPWRSGKDLRDENYSWDETFSSHEFSSRQEELMKFFNIRYECNDARDDFSKQLKEGIQNGGVFPQWFSADMMDELDKDSEYDQNVDCDEFDESDPINHIKYLQPGRSGMRKIDQMHEIHEKLKATDWFETNCDELSTENMTPIKPNQNLSGIEWKATVQSKRQDIISERTKSLPSHFIVTRSGKKDPNQNDVKIIDKSYLFKSFKAETEKIQQIINKTVEQFKLNKEQERAFRIVANHSVTPASEQLKMYLGGMGGTGKSQVIKALIEFFNIRNESHRFVVLGPTGTSAALLNGSTYHSFLGIFISGEATKNEGTNITQVQTRLDGIDYIFIDEVSMIACHDLYKISSQLAKARNEFDAPFGGLNMIFAGDFAQLAPVNGYSLYSGSVGTQLTSGLDDMGQESAIGKALWHQVTTVVILRENMRQKTQSEEDEKLRTALENMRYGACTPDDIKFLKSRVAGRRSEQPKLSNKNFRYVSIITALNTQRDKLNQLGAERFALDNKQTLTHFYSIDHIGQSSDPAKKRKRGRKSKLSGKHKNNVINPWLQNVIWNLPHSSTEHFPGKLSLCIGMPVMIKNNDATELCITKGQEGFVAGWNAIRGPYNKLVLDTLFVKLDRPAKTIKIDGLPENVVPITRATKTIKCTYQSDLEESIERQQVWVLPNFSMTDYASQGKTRPYNVGDLSYCRNHQSYYTCLSRSATAHGTIIIQGFSSKKITSGISGYLRQEFREQEILDEISKLRYENNLPRHICGKLRNPLIREYQNWKGIRYVPSATPANLKWTDKDPLSILPEVHDSPWQILKRNSNTIGTKSQTTRSNQTSTFVAAKGSVSINGKKRKLEENNIEKPTKKRKTTENSINCNTQVSSKKRKTDENDIQKSTKRRKITDISELSSPVGLLWDGENYSCAYDALYTILYNIWTTDHILWNNRFKNINNTIMKSLCLVFKKFTKGQISFEDMRDILRGRLHQKNKDMFPYGAVGTSVSSLAINMLSCKDSVSSSHRICSQCEFQSDDIPDRVDFILHPVGNPQAISTWLNSLQHETHEKCPDCGGDLKQPIFFNEPPSILVFDSQSSTIKLNKKIKFDYDYQITTLKLRGIVYYGNFHFTARIISPDDIVWYHDGMTTGCMTEREGKLDDIEYDALLNCRGKTLALAIYAQV
jgi:hypothetical protein